MDGVPAQMFSQDAEPYAPEDRPAPGPKPERLAFGSLCDAPQFANQEYAYPDSVKTVGERYIELATNSQEDMETYSALRVSTMSRGARVIVAETSPQWDQAGGTWRVLLRVQTRKFRSLKTSGQDPNEED